MKAETAVNFWNIARLHDDPVERIVRFARACEQHGIERAKQFMVPVAERFGGFNWSALDAEIAKENEGG